VRCDARGIASEAGMEVAASRALIRTLVSMTRRTR
jgi:hypothetical protein